ncbi:hypothetical protein Gorai_002576, partial [Gossypium raimondii]|nr:hypothetical protein [Gossypium raimondii]
MGFNKCALRVGRRCGSPRYWMEEALLEVEAIILNEQR